MRPRAFQLERFLAEHEFRAPHVMCGSDCESVSIGELLELEPGAVEQLMEVRLGYTESQGAPALRETIAELYETTTPADVLVHAGAEEAIFGFMNAVLEPGDHVVVHWPAYQSLHDVARAIGCEVTPWRADEAAGWSLDLDELRRVLRPRTRVIVINCPHNPTGYLMERSAFTDLLELAAARGVIVFSDEVYRGLEHRPEDRLPAACDLDGNAVSLGVLSKTYGLPGLRIGWVATRNHAILDAMAAFKDYTSICNSAPSEFLAGIALHHRERLARRALAIVSANVARMRDFMERHDDRLEWTPPRAGSVAFPALHRGDSERFCLDVLDRTGVLLLPGRYFDYGDRHFRIGLGRTGLDDALDRLDGYLSVRNDDGRES